MNTLATQYKNMPTLQDYNALICETQLLGDYYRSKTITTVTTKATKIILRAGSIYYQTRDGSNQRAYKLTNGKGQYINDPNVNYFNETCLFDSVPVSYTNPQYLMYGKKVVKTETLHTKYRVAHHLEKKVFFIAYDSSAIAGPLYSADVSGFGTEVDAFGRFDVMYKDLAIDQYTGDIFCLESSGTIKCFKKKHYYVDVETLVFKYLYGDTTSNANENDEDVIEIQ